MSDPVERTDAKLAPLMEHFAERLNRVFAYFVFVLEFEGDEDLDADSTHNTRAWRMQTIKNACLHTTLIALRDLDDFLAPRVPRTKPDDLKASDFGLKKRLCFLAVGERERINKLVAHTTSVGAQTQDFRWDILELASKCISQSLEFLKWVEKEYDLRYFYLYTAAVVIRNRAGSQFESIVREAEKRRVKTTNPEK
jgi:hypothetical protein